MPYNPNIHNRLSIRLQDYDYTQPGAYFITITSHQNKCHFGEIKSGIMKLSSLGEIAYYQWLQLPNRFKNIIIDEFTIMPNHLHGIIIIKEINELCTGEARDTKMINGNNRLPSSASPISADESSLPPSNSNHPIGTTPGSISAIIQNYKSLTTRKINMLLRTKNNTIWHRNFYEHIIRDETDFDRIVEYIRNNPASWSDDRYYSN